MIIQLEKSQKQRDAESSSLTEQSQVLKEKQENQVSELEQLRKEVLDVKYELKTERFNHQNTQNICQQLSLSV